MSMLPPLAHQLPEYWGHYAVEDKLKLQSYVVRLYLYNIKKGNQPHMEQWLTSYLNMNDSSNLAQWLSCETNCR